MGTSLAVIEEEFTPRLPAFKDVLEPFRIPAPAFRAGVLALFTQNPGLLGYCDAQSVMNSCMSIAVLGLRLDPSSGQSCVVPFKGKAQPIVMVKGYTVIAARAGYTLQGRLVREGDKVKEFGGAEPRIEHEIATGTKGKIIGAYAVARSLRMPTLFSPYLTIDDLVAIRDRSQGYQAAQRNNRPHPWSTDFDAMCVKSPKRLLAKDIPDDMLTAASWLEMQHDLGRVAHLRPDGQGIIDTTAEEVYPDRAPAGDGAPVDLDPTYSWILGNGEVKRFHTADEAENFILVGLRRVSPEQAQEARERNSPTLAGWPDQAAADLVRGALAEKIGAAA